jgi:hypothetical protein
LRFLSLSTDEPHLIFACSVSPNIFPHIFSLMRSLSLKASELSMTGKRRKNIQ